MPGAAGPTGGAKALQQRQLHDGPPSVAAADVRPACGLVAAAAFALYAMAYGVDRARRALLVDPGVLLGVGLLLSLASGAAATLVGRPFLSALWMLEPVAVGTPVIFDIGVCLVVTGVVSMMLSSLAEEV